MNPNQLEQLGIVRKRVHGYPVFALTITTDEAEAGDYSRLNYLLSVLTRMGRRAYRSTYISFERQGCPWEHQAEREYVRGMLEQFPHLMYFLIPVPPAYADLLYCLVDVLKINGMGLADRLIVRQDQLLKALYPLELALEQYGQRIGDLQNVDKTLRAMAEVLRRLHIHAA